MSTRDYAVRLRLIVVPVCIALALQSGLSAAATSSVGTTPKCTDANLRFVIPVDSIRASTWPNGTLSLVIPLESQKKRSAESVLLTKIRVTGSTYLGPGALPRPLGEIAQGEAVQLDAQLSPSLTTTQSKFPVQIEGTYTVDRARCTFSVKGVVRLPASGQIVTQATNSRTPKQTAATARFPPLPAPEEDEEFNEEEVTRQPLGQPRNLFAAPPSSTGLDRVRAFSPSDGPPSDSGPSEVAFSRNASGGAYQNGIPPDPSVAGADTTGFALISANTAVSYSRDFGATFTTQNLTGIVDPAIPGRNAFFPEDDGGVCCDQVVIYVPGRNIYVWLLQYKRPAIVLDGVSTTGQNRLRIAWATPQAAAADFLHAWTWIDLTASDLGLVTATDWVDYPDLAFSDNFVYVSVDHAYVPNPGAKPLPYGDRRLVARLSLNDMLDSSVPSVVYSYAEPQRSGLVKSHIVQSGRDAMYFSALPDTSSLSVFSWPDSTGTITRHDVNVSDWSNSDLSVSAPDTPGTIDWNKAPQGALGATRTDPSVFCAPGSTTCTGADHFLYFALSAGRDTSKGRAFPYVRVEKIDLGTFHLVSELDIWNADFAFATPALVSRPDTGFDEVAVSLAVGGGGSYADNAVGFLGDFEVFLTTSSNATQANFNRDSRDNIINDAAGNPTYNARYGDYFSVRNSISPGTSAGRGLAYSTLGYAVSAATAGQTCPAGGCTVSLQYVQFGRAGDMFPASTPIIH